MLLAIDAGNTSVKLGYHDGLTWHAQQRVRLSEFYLDPKRFLAHPFDQIFIANVAGPAFRRAMEATLPTHAIHWVQATASACGVSNGYQQPEQLGSDRWAMLIAARAIMQQACLVVSLGTTLTADALSAQGEFLGGCIAPGAQLMRAALAQGTHAIQSTPGNLRHFPDNTADAVETGIVQALLGVVASMQSQAEASTQSAWPIILSGGDAQLLRPHLNNAVQVVDNLVLDGLVRIAQEEKVT